MRKGTKVAAVVALAAIGVLLMGGTLFGAETAGPFSWELTSTSMSFYGAATIQTANNVSIGDVVAAFDPDGVCCGGWVVDLAGDYGALAVYGDDPLTPKAEKDEGAVANDDITFKIWDASTDTVWTCDETYTWTDGTQQFLSLNGVTPQVLPKALIELSRTSIAFPTVVKGETPADSTLVISNAGTDTLRVDSVKVTAGANNFSVFSVSPSTPAKVDTSATTDDNITVTVRFDPVEDGPLTGTLTIYSNAYGHPDTTVTLNGTGIIPKPAIVVSPDTVKFGSAKVGDTVLDSVIIKNTTGEADLYVTGLDTTAGGGQFAVQSPAVPDTVEPGLTDSLVVVLAFTPSAGGARTGKLVVTSNDPASPDTVVLTGTGTLPTVSVQPDSQKAHVVWKQAVWPDAALQVAAGEVVVYVKIKDAVDVNKFHVVLTYDDAILEYVAAEMGAFLTGDLVVNPSTGTVDLTGTAAQAESDSGMVAQVQFRTKDVGLSPVTITEVHVWQEGGAAALVPNKADGEVEVARIYFADISGDGEINVDDIQLVAGLFGQKVDLGADLTPAQMNALLRADIDGDGVVRINDVQMVAGRWNMAVPAGKLVPSSACLTAQILGNGTTVQAGETVWVEVVAEDAIGLGSFQFDLQFDESAFEVSRVVLGDLLGSTGNSAVGLSPVTDDGTVRFGAYSMGQSSGATGSGVLARVQIVAKADGEIALALENLMATDVLGGKLPVTILSAVEVAEGPTLPGRFALTQNYPNPFNPGTTIRYDVPASVGTDVQVRVEVYDVLGQVVRTLVDELKAPGSYDMTWSAKDQTGTEVSAGVYFYRMVAGDFEMTRKMILLK